MAQTEVTSISQDELSQILSGNVDSILVPSEKKTEVDETEVKEEKQNKEEEQVGFKKPFNTDVDWKKIKEEAQIEDEKETSPEDTKEVKTEKKEEKKEDKKKDSDIISLVNDLTEEGSLFGFEDGPVKSADEARELIKMNIEEAKKSTFDEIWKEKIESFSPQVQAILKYAESGGQDISPLLNAISQVEIASEFDIETEEGQESVIREYLKVQGWDEADIKEEIEISKDVNKLKSKAEKFLPKLNEMHQERVDQMMAEQEEIEKRTEVARQNYLTTIRTTLGKEKISDVKLSRSEKAMLWDSLTDIKYKSWSGQPTNKFFKKLEEIQAGETADYDHFLELVYMTLDRKGYKEKLKEQLRTEGAVEIVKKLKTEQRKNSNEETLFEEEKKPVIKRQGFKNPFA